MITSFVFFFTYLERLDQEDGIRFGTWGACYVVGDWAVGSQLLADAGLWKPEFPYLWVRKNFG